MGKGMIVRRGEMSTEDYRFYSGAEIKTRITVWNTGGYAIDAPTIGTSLNISATSIDVNSGDTYSGDGHSVNAVGSHEGTIKRGMSQTFRFELMYNSLIVGYLTDTVTLSQDGLTVSQSITYSSTSTPGSSLQFSFGISALYAYFLKVK